jgi:hypothetical protein
MQGLAGDGRTDHSYPLSGARWQEVPTDDVTTRSPGTVPKLSPDSSTATKRLSRLIESALGIHSPEPQGSSTDTRLTGSLTVQ